MGTHNYFSPGSFIEELESLRKTANGSEGTPMAFKTEVPKDENEKHQYHTMLDEVMKNIKEVAKKAKELENK